MVAGDQRRTHQGVGQEAVDDFQLHLRALLLSRLAPGVTFDELGTAVDLGLHHGARDDLGVNAHSERHPAGEILNEVDAVLPHKSVGAGNESDASRLQAQDVAEGVLQEVLSQHVG